MATLWLPNFLTNLSPLPVSIPEKYDGWQLRWSFFAFRPALFKTEGYFILGLVFYLIFFWWGSSVNKDKTKKWLSKHIQIYEQQFSKPSSKGLATDGYSDFFVFSTGRRAVLSLHTVFTLRPRHDLLQYIFQTARTFIELQYSPADDLQLDFKLSPGALPDNFVFAIVAKNELLSIKSKRWDLTFTKTSENPALPSILSVMSEYADITENILLKPLGNLNLATVFQDPKIWPYFRSLSITDQPRERPDLPIQASHREKHVILNLNLPDPSNADATVPLITAVFQLIDSLNKINLRPETKSKLKKTREELDKTLREEAEREKKEEAQDAKVAAKRKAVEERISKLSASEQRKEMEKERKRQLRKSQGKVIRK